MKKKNILILTLIVLSFVIAFVSYNKLPDNIPIHWGINGDIDRYGPKYYIFLEPIILVFSYLLFKFFPKIDPRKHNYKKYEKSYENSIVAFVLFFFSMFILTLLASLGYDVSINKFVPFFVGILFIVLGNYLPKSKSNFYFGIKTPWTLSDDTVWRKTHRLGGKLFTLTGLITLISTLLFNGTTLFYILIICLLISSLLPTIMSYIYFKNIENKK